VNLKEPKQRVKQQFFRINNNKDKKAYIILSDKQLANRVYEARVSHGTEGWRSVFTYDKRSKTIRNFKMPTFVLSAGKPAKSGEQAPAEFREFQGAKAKDQHVERQGHWLKNNELCLGSANLKKFENAKTVWTECDKKAHQLWTLRAVAIKNEKATRTVQVKPFKLAFKN